jgi:release factor H-coupled RctB family protein
MSEQSLPEVAARVHVVATAETWIEGEAVRQLEATARLPGMRLCVGMPDLHPGKGHPIGAAMVTSGVVYPHLVGGDIGCGMGLWQTDLKQKKAKRDKWAERLHGLEESWDGDTTAWLREYGIAAAEHDGALGTIGGGNHFAELQQVEAVADEAAFAALGLSREWLMLLIHSGSRGLGESILRGHTRVRGAQPLSVGTAECTEYLADHDRAVRWGAANRALIAHRFAEQLAAQTTAILDVCHNSVTPTALCGGGFLHRKGAAPADRGPVVIPGSRGAWSYLVAPTLDAERGPADDERGALSLAHGAGRKWKRSETRARLSERYRPHMLLETALKSRVICEDKDLLYEEAPQAYKDIDSIVAALVAAGLCQVIASFRPVITYKTRSGAV